MRQGKHLIVIALTLGAFTALLASEHVRPAAAASACKGSCKPLFDFCKNKAAGEFGAALTAFNEAKVSCKEFATKDEQKDCLKEAKAAKSAAKKAKKDAQKACKSSKKCLETECKLLDPEDQRVCGPASGSPAGAIVSSPSDSFQNCADGSLL
jgi:hypothetical protein